MVQSLHLDGYPFRIHFHTIQINSYMFLHMHSHPRLSVLPSEILLTGRQICSRGLVKVDLLLKSRGVCAMLVRRGT